MATTSKLKGRLVALLLLAVVLALPVIRVFQLRDGRESGAPPMPPKTTNTKPPTGQNPGHTKPPAQPGILESATPAEVASFGPEEGKKRLEEFHAAGTSLEQKRAILTDLLAMTADLDELLKAVADMPEDERPDWYAQVAGRCAKEQTAQYFKILDGMPPGGSRDEVIRAGMDSLDFPNLQRMMDQIRKQGSDEEIASMAKNFQALENPALKSADLLGYARKLPAPTEEEAEGNLPGDPATLRDSIAYGAGVLDAGSGSKSDLNRVRSDFGEDTAQHYIAGLGTALLDDPAEPEKFTGFLAATKMNEETRQYLVDEFADRALQGGAAQAVALGGKLPAADANTFYEELGIQLASRDPKEAARVLGSLPSGRARQVMAARLAQELESRGMSEEAARWRKER